MYKKEIFLLYKTNGVDGIRRYHVTGGTKYKVEGQKNKMENSLQQVLEISSPDRDTIDKLKTSMALSEGLEKLNKELNDSRLTKVKKKILLSFLKITLCNVDSARVCRECRLIQDIERDLPLGYVSLKAKEFEQLLNVHQNHWACEECRIELALITWKEDKGLKNYEILTASYDEIRERFQELLHKQQKTHVKYVCRVSPSMDDFMVVGEIKDALLQKSKTHLESKDELDNNNSISDSFLRHHGTAVTDKAIRKCQRCCHIWKDEVDLGYVSELVTGSSKTLISSKSWICWKCGGQPSMSVYVLETRNSDAEYFIRLKSSKSTSSLKEAKKKYVNWYVCLELYPKEGEITRRVAEKIVASGILRVNEMTVKTDVSKSNFQLMIFTLFVQEMCSVSSLICKECKGIYDKNEVFKGRFWTDGCDMFSSDYCCKSHGLRSVMYWNMSGWKTLEEMGAGQLKKLKEADVLCLSETHLVGRAGGLAEVTRSGGLGDRSLASEPAVKRAEQGRGSGGLLLAVRLSLGGALVSVEYSTVGVFQRVEVPRGRYVIGALYWKPAEREGASSDEWLRELDNLIGAYSTSDTHLIIGGDFNARLKGDDSNASKTLLAGSALALRRKSTDSTGNKRGRLLLSLMKRHGMVLLNGRSRSDVEGRATCVTVNGESVVDYVWISPSLVPEVADLQVTDLHTKGNGYHRALLLQLKQA